MSTDSKNQPHYRRKTSGYPTIHPFLSVLGLIAIGLFWIPQSQADPEQSTSVPGSAGDVHPLLIGHTVPDVELLTSEGTPFSLRQETAARPAVIIFYRGGWCPFCNRQLQQLQTVQARLRDLGYQMIAISPDRPAIQKKTIESDELSYRLVSDSEMKAAKAFGIAFRLDENTLTRYEQYGIDLEDASGQDHHLLPVPAVFVIGPDNRIGFTYVNPDYKVRIDADVLLAAARAVLKVQTPAASQ